MKTLIVYGTKYGCAEKCAHLLAGKLDGEVQIKHVSEGASDISSFDRIVIGGSIYAGQIQPLVRQFCENNLDMLQGKRVGLFMCAANVEKADEQLKQSFPAPLLESARAIGHFGYAIRMDKMNFFERIIVKMLMKTNESSEHILEENISRFAEQLAK